MNPAVTIIVLAALLTVPLAWALPRQHVQDGIAVATLVVVAFLSPASALWLAMASTLTPLAMTLGERLGQRGLTVLLVGGALLVSLIVSRVWEGPLWIGGAYFILRHLHVLIDWWMGRLENPGVLRHVRYQLFLPVIVAGPIHRFAHFERQVARRRWDAPAFFTGAERALWGAAQAVILGNWLMSRLIVRTMRKTTEWDAFTQSWALSGLEWIKLYFTFAGLSSIALGIALMMGLRLEENFNHPYVSRNLIEFWTRWHITLSQWCRDYVFQPITALTRAPVLGVLAAMTAMGLWHEVSVYYILWAVWQATGIVLARLAQRFPAPTTRAGRIGWMIAGTLSVFAWLSLTRPVITLVTGGFAP